MRGYLVNTTVMQESSKNSKPAEDKNAESLEELLLEFGGTFGNLSLVIGLPLITLYFYFCWRFNGGQLLPGDTANWDGFVAAIQPTWRGASIFIGWFVFQAVLQNWAPGTLSPGTELPDGRRLMYQTNGPVSFVVSLVVVAALHVTGAFPLHLWVEELGSIISAGILFCFVFAGLMYWWGKKTCPRHLSGSFFRDYFMGAGHNPRFPADGLFDFKFFCEARPGLIMWVVLNCAFMSVQYERYGFVSWAMILSAAFQIYYVVDYFINEPAVLTTMDIKHENFGFMLVFGDLAWVPFTYTLQAAYLVDHVHVLPVWAGVLTVALQCAGLYIFRVVNLQKHTFRSDPENAKIWGKPAEYISTARGSKLLVSGFWGWSRHFNYVGDMLMAISWSLPALFDSALPWFYPIYFAVLLVHRERRDHFFCHKKYGEDWERYCARVPWRIIPRIY
jgi:protein-S-isoprenylcysteine O-methyltransferase Ste14